MSEMAQLMLRARWTEVTRFSFVKTEIGVVRIERNGIRESAMIGVWAGFTV
jgi:hypothetical protein